MHRLRPAARRHALRAARTSAASARSRPCPASTTPRPTWSTRCWRRPAKLAANVLAPLNRVGDREGAVLENGVVRTAAGFREAYRRYADGGWIGPGVPRGAWAARTCPGCVSAAVGRDLERRQPELPALPAADPGGDRRHPAPRHRGAAALYGAKLVSGEWTGAMCLTEPQAGSDVGALRTRAVRDGDALPDLRHQDLHHLRRARPGREHRPPRAGAARRRARPAPRASRCSSCPSSCPTPTARPAARNDLRCVSLEHKLGIRASPTCVMAYGDDEGAVGFLLGEENQGMRCMFTMMNNARLAVGHQGLGLAERAYQQALAYARERVQGARDGRAGRDRRAPRRAPHAADDARADRRDARALPTGPPASSTGASAMPTRPSAPLAADRVALLTPDGQGLVHRPRAGDRVRRRPGARRHGLHRGDRRRPALCATPASSPIYEGTNGIQAMDLVGRKLDMAGGAAALAADRRAARRSWPALPGSCAPALADALDAVERTTRHLQASRADDRAAGGAAYLRLFATALGRLPPGPRRARRPSGETAARDWPGLARFYVHALLPPALAAGAADRRRRVRRSIRRADWRRRLEARPRARSRPCRGAAAAGRPASTAAPSWRPASSRPARPTASGRRDRAATGRSAA